MPREGVQGNVNLGVGGQMALADGPGPLQYQPRRVDAASPEALTPSSSCVAVQGIPAQKQAGMGLVLENRTPQVHDTIVELLQLVQRAEGDEAVLPGRQVDPDGR